MAIAKPLTRLAKIYVPEKCDYCQAPATTIIRRHGEITDAMCDHHAAEFFTPSGHIEGDSHGDM